MAGRISRSAQLTVVDGGSPRSVEAWSHPDRYGVGASPCKRTRWSLEDTHMLVQIITEASTVYLLSNKLETL